jgi:AraC family transcriptional regulator
MGISFAPPRLEPFGPVVLAGLQRSHRVNRDRKEISQDISVQWHALAAMAGALPVLPPRLGYGVVLHVPEGAGTLDYFCGLPVDGLIYVPTGFEALALPRMTVAVFEHHEHVSLLHSTTELIFATILPMAGIEPADEENCPAEFIQRYTERFDPATGLGGVEILVPVKV